MIAEAFRNGGWGMFPTLVLGLLAVAASLRYAAWPERRLIPLLGALGLATVAAGTLGFVTGMIKTFSVIGEVTPDKRFIWMIGCGESLNNLGLAFALVTLAAIGVSLGAYRFARREAHTGA